MEIAWRSVEIARDEREVGRSHMGEREIGWRLPWASGRLAGDRHGRAGDWLEIDMGEREVGWRSPWARGRARGGISQSRMQGILHLEVELS